MTGSVQRQILIPEVHKTAHVNELSDRAALGLPEHYVAGVHGQEVAFNRLRTWSKEALSIRVESPDAPLHERLAAGRILALVGDPRINGLNPPMVDVPGGRVILGLETSAVDEVMATYGDIGILRPWIEKETPTYEVSLKAFRIGRFPVTNQEYELFLSSTKYPEIPSSWPFGFMIREMANHPVFSISSEAADAYAQWLTQITGRNFRLPSEAEWEYAASAGGAREFPWGDTFSIDMTNTIESGIGNTTPVGMYSNGASPYGVLDMAGNVEEYVSNNYSAYPGGEFIADDLTLQGKSYRVARGGSFTRFRDLARCRRRHGRYPRAIYVMGFRLVEDVD